MTNTATAKTKDDLLSEAEELVRQAKEIHLREQDEALERHLEKLARSCPRRKPGEVHVATFYTGGGCEDDPAFDGDDLIRYVKLLSSWPALHFVGWVDGDGDMPHVMLASEKLSPSVTEWVIDRFSSFSWDQEQEFGDGERPESMGPFHNEEAAITVVFDGKNTRSKTYKS